MLVCMVGWGSCRTPAGVRGQLLWSRFSLSSLVGSGNDTQVVWLSWQPSPLLNHLTSPPSLSICLSSSLLCSGLPGGTVGNGDLASCLPAIMDSVGPPAP